MELAEFAFVPLPGPVLMALIEGDLASASAKAGADLPSFFLEEAWLWRIRLDQITADPRSASWVVRAVKSSATGEVVGHAGFHGPPDEEGVVEVAYTVIPSLRGRGLSHAMLDALLSEAQDRGVRAVRATIAPDNTRSLATVRRAGFVEVGEQWDEVDGRELVFLKQLGGRLPRPPE